MSVLSEFNVQYQCPFYADDTQLDSINNPDICNPPYTILKNVPAVKDLMNADLTTVKC